MKKYSITKIDRKKTGIVLVIIGFCFIWLGILVARVSNASSIADEVKVKDDDLTLTYKIDGESIPIPIQGDMVPQGLAIAKNKNLISAYDYKQEDNSIIYVVDMRGNTLNICTLDIISHVGGLAYDYINDLLWVAGVGGYINAYNIDDILTKKNAHTVYKINVGDGLIDFENNKLSLVSFLTYYERELYVGSFSLNKMGIVKKYEIKKEDGKVELEYVDKFKIPDKVQGITFYSVEDTKYMFLSISYGRNNNSLIKGYVYNEDIGDYTKDKIEYVEYDLPPMVEQITVNDDYIYVLYESKADIYSNCPNITNNITVIKINNIMRELG